jgi:hypothetical protein
MALITKQVKISNKVEGRLAKLFKADSVLFKRLKFVTPFIFRFTFFVLKGGKVIGTLNYFWDIRKMNQWIFLRRFSDNKIIRLRHLYNQNVPTFFGEEND